MTTTFRLRDNRGVIYSPTDSADAVMLHATLEHLLNRIFPGWDQAQNTAGAFSFYPKTATLSDATLLGIRALTVQTLAKAVAGCHVLYDTGSNHWRKCEVLGSDAKLLINGEIIDLADQAVVVSTANSQNTPLAGAKATLVGVSPDGLATWFKTDAGLVIAGAITTVGDVSAPCTIFRRTGGGAYVLTPDAPDVTHLGSSAGASVSYSVVAKNKAGEVTAVSAPGSMNLSGDPITGVNANQLVVLPVDHGATYDWYRNSGPTGTPTTGKIATTTDPRYTDTGAVGDGSTAPAVNLTAVGSEWTTMVLQ